MPKRLGAPIAEPCLHSVSDPLPFFTLESERSTDEWFKTNFDALFAIPPPVDITELDLSTQWNVELFNNYSNREDLKKTLAPREPASSFRDAITNVRYSRYRSCRYRWRASRLKARVEILIGTSQNAR